MSYDDEDDFLMGGGKVPSASFLRRGDRHEGVICEKPTKRQQLDFKTRQPVFWENGDPRMQLVVTVQTDENDPEIEDDDGRRRFYLRYTMLDAVRDAVKEAGAPGLREGGYLAIEFTSQDKPKSRGAQGTKHYQAEYTPPDENADTDEFMADGSDVDADDDGDDGDWGNDGDGDSGAEYDEPEPPARRPAAKRPAAKAARPAARPARPAAKRSAAKAARPAQRGSREREPF